MLKGFSVVTFRSAAEPFCRTTSCTATGQKCISAASVGAWCSEAQQRILRELAANCMATRSEFYGLRPQRLVWAPLTCKGGALLPSAAPSRGVIGRPSPAAAPDRGVLAIYLQSQPVHTTAVTAPIDSAVLRLYRSRSVNRSPL